MFGNAKAIPTRRLRVPLLLPLCLVVLLNASPASGTGQELLHRPRYKWQETRASAALLNRGRVVWQFNHGPDTPKPYFHPLALTDGTVLTCLTPRDHPWHRALWFSWKMVNGINYWEEDRKTGQSEGRTEVVHARVTLHHDYSATLLLTLSYHAVNGPVVLTEDRKITVSRPDQGGRYRIDWQGTFTAGQQDVVLQGGTSGGGYAGLSVRISEDTRDWRLIDSEGRVDTPGGPTAKNTHGQKATWADFSVVDGASGEAGGIAIFQHPLSFRYPTHWHNIINDKSLFGYFSPAPLWAEPYTLSAAKSLTVRYLILVHPGLRSKEQLNSESTEFAGSRQ